MKRKNIKKENQKKNKNTETTEEEKPSRTTTIRTRSSSTKKNSSEKKTRDRSSSTREAPTSESCMTTRSRAKSKTKKSSDEIEDYPSPKKVKKKVTKSKPTPKTKIESPKSEVKTPKVSLSPKKKAISKPKKTDYTLSECLTYLNTEEGSIPLPGREDKIAFVNNFIEHVFNSEPHSFNLLFISGSPGTGKTATLKHCLQILPTLQQVRFVNCKTDPPPSPITKSTRPKPILLILDEVESLPHLKELILNCKRFNCSIIGISNAHDDSIAISAQSIQTNAQSIMFNSYTTTELKNIITERIGGSCSNISEQALLYISKKVGQNHGDARSVISTLNYVLTEAISRGMEQLDVKTTMELLEEQNEVNESDEILKEIPIVEQIALVSIYKMPGKNWRDEFVRLLNAKHIKEDINPVDIFDRLDAYGFVIGGVKNPKCRLTVKQLKEGLDPIAASLV
ncbi:cleft lip and palate transmembrane 1 [Histomonas meleagridis]|uniref:cleft lip and palate transmembrane 1 n=1 Tax=Histomonas meleagridis TaxID=135588 RepID=UPI00355A3E49|nr:cleft lip and palate transmembrane 1 [Histomonas meleagridis]KAH0807147.1 cleft lip and palate transmembrane 1 [Histomonas meleagridis]